MLRFLAILAGIVIVVWSLSLLAAPPMPPADARDATAPEPVAAIRAATEPDSGEREGKDEERHEEKKGEAKKKGEGKGKGRKKPISASSSAS